jgi:hypothetical protein
MQPFPPAGVTPRKPSRAIRVSLCLLLAAPSGSVNDWLTYLADAYQLPSQRDINLIREMWRGCDPFGGHPWALPGASGITVTGGFLDFKDWSGNFHSLNAPRCAPMEPVPGSGASTI